MGLCFLNGGDSAHWRFIVNANTMVLNSSQLSQCFFRAQCAFGHFEPLPHDTLDDQRNKTQHRMRFNALGQPVVHRGDLNFRLQNPEAALYVR